MRFKVFRMVSEKKSWKIEMSIICIMLFLKLLHLMELSKALNYLLDWYDKGKRRNYELTPKGVALIAICYSQLDEFGWLLLILQKL